MTLASVRKVSMGRDVRSVFLTNVHPIYVIMVGHAKRKATIHLLAYVLKAIGE